MDIVIIGAGLAGPLLAQGLIGNGHRPIVIEHRGAAEQRRTGYRIHLDPQGDLALQECLPEQLYELAVLTAGRPGSGVRVLDTDLTVVHEIEVRQPDPSQGRHLTVDRQTLREVLLAGLDATVRSGLGFARYALRPDGRVAVELTDGSVVEGDLLVGADGSASRVRQQLLPGFDVREIGQLNIFGRTRLTPQVLPDVPAAALAGFGTVAGNGRAMPLAAHRFAHPPQPTADRLWPGLRMSADGDYLMWVFSVPTAEAPGDRTPAALQAFVADQVAGWHPSLRRLVLAAEPDMTQSTVVRTSRRPEPWPAGPVTLIGDAAHPMIPAGIGAAVALADAALLCRELGQAEDRATMIAAVDRYQRRMLDYGFAAVEQSEQVGGTTNVTASS